MGFAHDRCLVVIFMLTALISGCGIRTTVKPTPDIGKWPTIEKEAASVGLYFSPGFSEETHSRKIGPNTWTVPIGAASVDLFDAACRRLFEHVTRIPSIPPEKGTSFDFFLAPSLEHFDFKSGMDGDADRFSVVYRTTLYSPQGVPVASWRVRGNAVTRSLGTLTTWIEDDLDDAAIRFMSDFRREAGPGLEVIRNARNQPPSAIEAESVTLAGEEIVPAELSPEAVAALQVIGVIFLKIEARGQADHPLIVRASDMSLRLGRGQQLDPLPISVMLSLLDKTSQKGLAVTSLLGPIGFLVTHSEEASKTAERSLRQNVVESSLFGERALRKGDIASGLVAFRLPKESRSGDSLVLSAWAVDPASAAGLRIDAPIVRAQQPTSATGR